MTDEATAADGGGFLHAYERYRTSDPLEAASLSAAVLAPNRLTPFKGPEVFEARCRFVSSQCASLIYMRYGAEVVIDRPAANDYVAILIPTAGSLLLRHCGREYLAGADESLAVTSARDPLHMQWSPGASVLAVRISGSAIDDALSRMLAGDVPGTLELNVGAVSGRARSIIMAAVDLFASTYEEKSPGSPMPAVVARRLEEQVLSALLLGLDHNYRSRLIGEETRPGRRTVREVVDLVCAETDGSWTVHELARAVGVTVRALELGFRKELGKTPREFVHEIRMARAHDELIRALPGDGTSVTDVATKWGFGHTGRFAAAYLLKFGVKPSETLRSSGTEPLR
ncbi:hypothetical protein BWI15_01190 [Kribbella sp. ALI-6-A]|uniref:AraC family transcriptional regulator n=1 Tax=Kribbella sp. ALI-6-A TaxID=1933817 RepID=UPI00097C6856|nr:AraC family transcriptional regulator [Kribbella sp. ALI-6-A]ONI78514.1 hypothetical protein BWI15_01190 [Kribbella sp. ALI-6-A]